MAPLIRTIVTEGYRPLFRTASESWEPSSTNTEVGPFEQQEVSRYASRPFAKLRTVCNGPLAPSVSLLRIAVNRAAGCRRTGLRLPDCLTDALGLSVGLEKASLKGRWNNTMAIAVKKITLWRCEADNRPGVLASTLEPLAEAGADLQVVMGYRYPGGTDKAAIELHPVSGRKSTTAAKTAGLAPSPIPALLVQGDNRQGLGHALAKAIGEAGINLNFVMAHVVGRRYSAVFGFENDVDAAKDTVLIRKAAVPIRKR